jgi:guanine nucleotide-binding protein alpha-1 subunit
MFSSRTQRHTWAPFFDDANAIIYVAPISAYDQVHSPEYSQAIKLIYEQYLEEDPQVNRIEDSVQLFNQICSNRLLVKVHLVLFLSESF